MPLFGRERPPTALDIAVTVPGQTPYRWAADALDAKNKPDGMTFTTGMPGGFDQFNCTLNRDTRLTYPDLQEFADVTVRGLGGAAVAWQGRLEEFPSQAGQQSQLTPQAVGYQDALQDDQGAAMVFIDGDLTKWSSPSTTRQLWLAENSWTQGDSEVGTDTVDNAPSLLQTITGGWTAPNKPAVDVVYDAGAGCEIAKIYYSMVPVSLTDDANWGVAFYLAPTGGDYTDWGSESGNLLSTVPVPVVATFVPGVPARFALLEFNYDATPAGVDSTDYVLAWDALQVIGDHDLPLQGSGPYGVLASDAIAYAIKNYAPLIQYTTGPSGTIQPSLFAIPQLVFTPTTVSQMIQTAAQYELLDYAVWEATTGTSGPTAYVNQRGARGRQWQARVGPAQLQDAGPQASRIWNGVIVQFTAFDGTTQSVGPPGSGATYTSSSLLDADPDNPANQVLVGGSPIKRWTQVTAGTETQTSATQIGATFLAEQKLVNTSGQAALVGHVQDQTGSWWPSWMVRAGDTIAFVDAADTSARRIVSTSYAHTSRTNTVQLDTPPDGMQALLDRLSIVLSPLGLT